MVLHSIMKPKYYPVLQMAIENGISLGYSRAFKYDDDPSAEVMKESINASILNEIHEWFEFSDEPIPECKIK